MKYTLQNAKKYFEIERDHHGIPYGILHIGDWVIDGYTQKITTIKKIIPKNKNELTQWIILNLPNDNYAREDWEVTKLIKLKEKENGEKNAE